MQRDVSLDAECEEGTALVHGLAAADATPEQIVLESNWEDHQKTVLYRAISGLADRDRLIVERRHLAEEPATLKDLSEEFGVSIERVRQLEARAMKRLKEAVAH